MVEGGIRGVRMIGREAALKGRGSLLFSEILRYMMRYRKANIHLPLGVDIVPSPVMRAVTAVVLDPLGSEEGGNIRTAVSISSCAVVGASADVVCPSDSDVGSGMSAAGALDGEGRGREGKNDIGWSRMAIHLATLEPLCVSSHRGEEGRNWVWIRSSDGIYEAEEIKILHVSGSGKSDR